MVDIKINFLKIFQTLNKIDEKTKNLCTKNLNIIKKEDGSSCTDFDILSDEILNKNLPKYLLLKKKKKKIYYFSEESIKCYNERKNWEYYWSIDPLDGTSSYIKKKSLYSINIALIHKNIPILGFIYIPYYKFLVYNDLKKTYFVDEFPENIKNLNVINKIEDDEFITFIIKEYYGKNFKKADEFDISALDSILISLGHKILYKNNKKCLYNRKNYNYKNLWIKYAKN